MFFLYLSFPFKAAELFFTWITLFLSPPLRISVADHSLLSCTHKPCQLALVGLVSSNWDKKHGIASGEVLGPVFLGTTWSSSTASVLPAFHCTCTAGQDSAHPTTTKAFLFVSNPLCECPQCPALSSTSGTGMSGIMKAVCLWSECKAWAGLAACRKLYHWLISAAFPACMTLFKVKAFWFGTGKDEGENL